jgi:hypothetical protein
VDEGNIKRYSYDYVSKVHTLREQQLDAMKGMARTMEGIVDKIRLVYKSILKDDFAFHYRNDEELASRLMVQGQFYKLKADLINKLSVPNIQPDLEEKAFQEIGQEFDKWVSENIKKHKGIVAWKEEFRTSLNEMFRKYREENTKIDTQRSGLKNERDYLHK